MGAIGNGIDVVKLWMMGVAKRLRSINPRSPGVVTAVAFVLAGGVLVAEVCSGPLNGKGQLVATVLGLTFAAWFAARRQLLLEKAAEYQPMKEAIELTGRKEVAGQLAGVRRLHLVAQTNPECKEIVKDVLCGHIASTEASTESKQLALRLLFGEGTGGLFGGCTERPWLDGADLRGARLDDLCLDETILRNGQLEDVSSAELRGADLRDTRWIGVIKRTHMDGAMLSGVELSGTRFEDVHFVDADMSQKGKRTAFIACKFLNCDFSGSNWDGTDFSRSRFDEHCKGITFDRCKLALVAEARGIPEDVVDQLRREGFGGYPSRSDEGDGP